MTTKEIKNEIRQCCFNLIINSNVEDWKDMSYVKDNIYLYLYPNKHLISASICTDNTLTHTNEIACFEKKSLWFCYNRNKRKEIRKITKKYKEISEYIKNKIEYDEL
jgi:hypothetical protein